MTQTGNRRRWPFFILAGVLFLSGFATMKAEELSPMFRLKRASNAACSTNPTTSHFMPVNSFS